MLEIRFAANEDGQVTNIIYTCPKDGKTRCSIAIYPEKNANDNSWHWNENRASPTAMPSINCNHCKWHGFLQNGKFVEV